MSNQTAVADEQVPCFNNFPAANHMVVVIEEALANLENQLKEHITQSIERTAQRLELFEQRTISKLEISRKIQNARTWNSTAHQETDSLYIVPLSDGTSPANLPETLAAFRKLGEPELSEWMARYEAMPAASTALTVDHKRHILARYLGIVL
ncbi:hypothetical protein FRC12_006873 [Ceratobasidium sp. 428]|nr:hypothetical protein FRC12_006873 [Ceratobasidium sp. 428]